MIRLNIIVEGQTEEAFVGRVLMGPLALAGVGVSVRCVETSRDKKRHKIFRGGLLDYNRAKRDLLRWMKEDQKQDAWFTTMFDLYALPDDFPGRIEAKRPPTALERVISLEEAFSTDFAHPRFIPYIQLHEFEALLFADPAKLDWAFIEHEEAIAKLVEAAASFKSPEDIDDGQTTAPSKRIIQAIPEYAARKTSAGPLVAEKIGLPILRAKCLHFDAWLKKIEALGGSVP